MPTDLADDHFPPTFKRIFSFFSLVDKLFVFTVKRKLRCTILVIQSLYTSFDTTNLHDEYTNDEFLQEFRILSALCPLGIQLSKVDKERIQYTDISCSGQHMTLDNVELSFPLFSGASPSQSAKRHKMLLAAINSYLSDQYLEIAGAAAIKSYSFARVKKFGWPSEFDSEAIVLPLQLKFLLLKSKVESDESSTQQKGGKDLSYCNSDIMTESEITVEGYENLRSYCGEESASLLGNKSDPMRDSSSHASVSLAAMGGASAVLDKLKGLEVFYRNQIVHVEVIPGRIATYEDLRSCNERSNINLDLLHVVGERIGVKRYYTHQAKAINHILSGSHVVVSTATSSGKSVIYNLPVLSKIMEDQRATAFYLFPTKVRIWDVLDTLYIKASAYILFRNSPIGSSPGSAESVAGHNLRQRQQPG